MNVLSLFDGMSGGQIALTNMGVKVNNYYASEIDKHAIGQTQLNFPGTKQLGSVTEWQTWDIDWGSINILFAGSPCQGFSFAGKQLAFNDPRSKLFFVFVDILNHIRKFNPDVLFLLENVKMKSEHEAVITQYCGINPIEINSALLSAQNRVRLYWTNIGVVKRGLFDEFYPGIPQPKDKGILLRDILESDVPDKYYMSQKYIEYLKARAEKFAQPNIRDLDGKASCIMPGNEGKQGSDMNFIVSSRGRESSVLTPKRNEYGKAIRKDYEAGKITEQRKNIQQLEPRTDGKTNCLTSVQKDNLVMQLNQSTESNGCQPYQQNRVYDIDGISPALMAQMSCGTHAILEQGMKIRRLTPTECARLQTIPTWYKWQCSDTQQYRMLGNGWTNDVIEWILSFAKF